MSSYEISTLAGIATAAQIMTRDGTVGVVINGKPVTIRFQNDSQANAEAAYNIMVTAGNLKNSPIFIHELSKSDIGSFVINVTTSIFGLPSSGTSMFGTGIININTNDINREYLTRDGTWENFTLQHILNHEILHTITGLPDGVLHNRLTNQLNEETDGGNGRLDYENARCFLAGTNILMSDGGIKSIENICVGDLVKSFDPSSNNSSELTASKRVTRLFRNTTKEIINLRGLLCTPGHVFMTKSSGSERACEFKTIANILKSDDLIVDQLGNSIRARTGAFIGSTEDAIVNVVFNDVLGGKLRRLAIRAGAPVFGVRKNANKSIEFIPQPLNFWMEKHHIKILENRTLLAEDGSIFEAVDWPSGQTPLCVVDTHNWIVEIDDQPYMPDWIANITECNDHKGLQVLA